MSSWGRCKLLSISMAGLPPVSAAVERRANSQYAEPNNHRSIRPEGTSHAHDALTLARTTSGSDRSSKYVTEQKAEKAFLV
jgi:hypothetical protein